VTESLVVALAAGTAAMLVAYWGTRALVALSPSDVIRRTETGLDAGVFAFTLAVSLATIVLVGLVPALQTSRGNVIEAVRQSGGRSVAGGIGARTRRVFVVAEIALAVVLLTGAGLLVKTLFALHGVELGYQADHVLVARATGVRSRADNDVYFAQLMDRVRDLPGVAAVGATSIPPGDFSNAGTGSHFIDRIPDERRDGQSPVTVMTIVAPGSFEALGISVKSGRDFDARDTADRPLVAIVNEALVRASLPGQNPIGRTIHCLFDRPDPMTIVGVVADVRQRNPALEALPECYMPYRQHGYNNATLNILVRTVGDPAALITAVRRTAFEVSPDVPIAFTTMEDQLAKGLEDSRFRALLFGLFAAFAACLAMAGVYGVMAYTVQQRTKEIGVRMALGASQTSVFRLVLGQGLVLAIVGLSVGLAASVGMTRLLETVLYEVEPFDLPVYLGVAILLGLVTLVAGYVPARRASVLNPVEVLKAE
jgi:predicted permease